MTDIFPITIEADRERGWSESSFSKDFHRVRPAKMTWFAYDVVIHSPTHVDFIVFDMYRGYNLGYYSEGGVGDEIGRLEAVVSKKLTAPYIDSRLFRLAAFKRRKELEAAELLIITTYADQIRKEAGL